MRLKLGTIQSIRACRQLTGGDVGARLHGICDTCGSEWTIDMDEAVDHLGDAARPSALIGLANCQNCSGGLCADTVIELSTDQLQAPFWFGGSFNRALDGDTIADQGRRRPIGKALFGKKR